MEDGELVDLEIDCSERAGEFIEKIVERMLVLFPITRTEAVGRINEGWRNYRYVGDDHIVFHETVDYWAHTIYYGVDSQWWRAKEGLVPQPYAGPK